MNNSSDLKIYIAFHDATTFSQIKKTPYCVPLCVDPVMEVQEGIERVGEFPFPAQQLAEARAFYHAMKNTKPPRYVGFTPYRHNAKFTDCASLEMITPELVEKAFVHEDVKAIAFRPITDFLRSSEHFDDISGASRTGFNRILFQWLRSRGMNRFQEVHLRNRSARKYVPFCNAFVLRFDEFRKFFQFADDFIHYAHSVHGLERFPFDFNMGRKGREWAEYTERLLPLYLLIKYHRDYRLAFIERNGNIIYPNQISVASSLNRHVDRWKERRIRKKSA